MNSYISLKEIADVIDSLHNTPSYTEQENSYPMVRVVDINNIFLNLDNCLHVNKENYKTHTKKYVPQKGDIIITRVGSYGMVALVDTEEKFCLGQNLAIIHPIKIDSKFLYYYILSPYIQNHIYRNIVGSTYKCLSLKDINMFPVNISLLDSVKIGKILYTIDKKIQNNKKQIETLESLAKTIYDYWFIQFDFPNEEGRPYKSSGGKMIWNEELKREIPEEWNICKLKDLENDIITGKTPSTKHEEYYGRDIPFITIGDIRNNMYIVSTSQYLSVLGASTQQNKFIPENSLCVSCIATIGLVGISVHTSQTNQQINSVVCKNKSTLHYLYFYLKDYFVNSSAIKSGNTFANMNKQEFSNISILFNPKLIDFFFLKTASIFEKIKKLSIENSILVKQKEFLLPLLMNGQVSLN